MLLSAGYVELGSDEHAFVIRGDMGSVTATPWDGSTLVTIPDDVGDSADVLINTAHQWGPFSVTTQVHDGAPEVDPVWEDVVEFSLACNGELVVAELVNHDPSTTLVAAPGTYRIRVSGRGRLSDAESNLLDVDDDPDEHDVRVEHYLVEAWLASPAEPVVVRETSSWALAQEAGPPPEPQIESAEPGLAAAARIGRDADRAIGGRDLCGAIKTVRVEATVPGTARRVSRYLKRGPTLSRHVPSWAYMSGPDWEEIGAATFCHAMPGHPDQLSGSQGAIRVRLVDDVSPLRWVSEWAWMVPAPGGGRALSERVPLFPEDTTVIAEYTQSDDEHGRPRTLVRIEHHGVPVEWIDDLSAWWMYQMEMMASLSTG